MRLTIPKLRTWHLLGLVAASAAFLWALPLRWSAEDPTYALMRQLRSPRADERRSAVVELGQLERSERRAIGPLTEALFDVDVGVRIKAARVLCRVVRPGDDEAGMVKAALASALGDRDPAARLEIVRSLVSLRVEPKVVVPTLLELARGRDATARAEAVSLLGPFGRRSEPALAALFDALADADAVARMRAVEGLGYCSCGFGIAPEPLLGRIKAVLIAAADEEDWGVRATAVGALGALAARSGVEQPRVIEALSDSHWLVQNAAANAVCWSRPERRSPALVPALIRALANPVGPVRDRLAKALGSLGIEAEAALPPLRTLANDPEEYLRAAATEAIKAIEEAAREFRTVTLPGAIAELGDANPTARVLAARRLEKIGPKASDAVPALLRCLDDGAADVRRASAAALGQLGPGAAVALPALAKLAESDPDERVRQVASLSRSTLAREGGGGDRAP